MAFFSVIVPIYNVEKYLEKCISSVLKQSFSDFELILVDDGSKDESGTLCDRFADSDERIRVIHKKNGGLVSARKAGAQLALGEYVVCVDGDDWISDLYLENFHKAIVAHPGLDMVICNAYRAEECCAKPCEMSVVPGYYCHEKLEKEIFPYALYGGEGRMFPPNVWAKAIRTSLYLKHQMNVDDSIKIGEDNACVKPCIFESQSICVLDTCGYYYRFNPDSMTKNRTPFEWETPKKIAMLFEKSIIEQYPQSELQIYSGCVHSLFNVCVSQFYRDESFLCISGDIRKHLRDPFYKKAIKATKEFDGKRIKCVRFALEHQMCLLMWLYCKTVKRNGF